MRFWLLPVLAALAAGAPPAKPAMRQIKVPVWVDGQPGQSLTVKDLKARLEGLSSRVLAVQGPADDLIVIAVLDLIGDLAYVEPAKEALIAGMRKLAPRAWVALMRAQDGLKVLADPTGDRDALEQAVRALPVSGKAGLLDTVEAAERLADGILARTSVRVAVFYLTDTDVENYREDFTNPVINSSDSHDLSRRFPEVLVQEKISKLEAALAGRQAPLFIVHLHYRADRLNEAYQNGLKQLAEATGGGASFCRSDTEIPEAVGRALETISSYYCVTLALPAKPLRSLQVQLEAGGGRGLSYRNRLVLRKEKETK